jgi:hypothetical protein
MQGRKSASAGTLFNLKDDLGETTDVSTGHPGKVRQLEEFMTKYIEDYEANKRPIGWAEGYSGERAIKEKRASREAKATKKEKWQELR